MGAKKGLIAPQNQPGAYRDEPDRDDAASSSSAVLLEDIDYPPDEELPAYSDEPPAPGSSTTSAPARTPAGESGWDLTGNESPFELPFSSHDLYYNEYRTLFPDYSNNATTLFQMINDQAGYPPAYIAELFGTHTETRRNGNNKESKDRVTDFLLRISITPYLYPWDGEFTDRKQTLPGNKRGYRGTRFPSLTPVVNVDIEEGIEQTNAELREWCERYVNDKSAIKSFTLKRKVINHDTQKLTQLFHACLQETGYRGHLSVKFSLQGESLIVYSPGLINSWRTTTWVRWFFYLTFLWIITWPILILCTARYEVVQAVFPYANKKPGEGEDGVSRLPTALSEVDWFRRWESAIRRAAKSRMNCTTVCLSEAYRQQTIDADMRDRDGNNRTRREDLPSTGSAFADGALTFLGNGLRIASDYENSHGWGADT